MILPNEEMEELIAEYRANSGGPMSRTRTEHIRLTLLGRDAGDIDCPLVLRLGLDFGEANPRTVLSKLLEQAGLLTPAAIAGQLPLTADGVNDLARLGSPMLDLDGELRWQERRNGPSTPHPDLAAYAEITRKRRGARRERASQFFHWCVLNKVRPADPGPLEQEIQDCVALLRRRRPA